MAALSRATELQGDAVAAFGKAEGVGTRLSPLASASEGGTEDGRDHPDDCTTRALVSLATAAAARSAEEGGEAAATMGEGTAEAKAAAEAAEAEAAEAAAEAEEAVEAEEAEAAAGGQESR